METFYLEPAVLSSLPIVFFQMIIFVSLHTVQCLENVPFLYALQTGGVTYPAHILHSAFTDLWAGKEDLCVSE